MLTTVTPAAHEDNIANSAVTPSNAAPYPVEVGTAMTGTATKPPTTLASAPSMPATTTTTSTARNSSTRSISRCSPATPTSRMSVTSSPIARAIADASSATAPSDVPAVTTATRKPVSYTHLT